MTNEEITELRRKAIQQAFQSGELRLAFFELVERLGYRDVVNTADPYAMAYYQGLRAAASALLDLIASADELLPSRMQLEHDEFQKRQREINDERRDSSTDE